MLAFISQLVLAQTNVRGKVFDDNGEALVGVNVVVVGTTQGAISDATGSFSIRVNNPASAQLEFSYIGYELQTISVGARVYFDITLQEDGGEMLDEVVVVAYGQQRKETLTGAISSVGTDVVINSPSTSVGNSLAGKITGLSSVQSSGQPGSEDPSIYIRGVGGLSTGSSSPLILVDGVERSFFQMDPNEIDDVTVLKDASATAVFGVRGANGVILVTTRRGKEGATSISVNSSFGATALSKALEMADSYTYALMKNEENRNDGLDETFSAYQLERFKLGDEPVMYTDTDWVDYMTKPVALQTQHNINITGGDDKVSYFVSMGYLFQDGNFKQFGEQDNTFWYNRYNYRANLDVNMTSTTLIKVGIGGVIGQQHEPYKGSDLWSSIAWSQPMSGIGLVDGVAVKLDNASFGSIKLDEPFSYYYNYGYNNQLNNTMNLDLSLTQDLEMITKGLSFEVKGAYNTSYSHRVERAGYTESYISHYLSSLEDPELSEDDPEFDKTIVYEVYGQNGPLTYSDETSRSRNWYMEGSLRYAREFGNHNVGGLILYNQSKKYYPSQYTDIPTAYVGFVGRITYDYKTKYLAEFNIGYNGSENFAQSQRFGTFPAFSVGYIVTEEEFMKKQNVVSYLKLRASAGLVGSDNMSSNRFLYLSDSYTVDLGDSSDVDQWSAPYYGYNFGYDNSVLSAGAIASRIGNEDVTWETSFKQNYGVDVHFLDSKLKISADVFHEYRSDILITVNTVASVTGLTSDILPVVNKGEVENGGYEIQVKWDDKVGHNFRYWIDANLSFARNKIIYQDEVEPNEPYMSSTGHPVGTKFGYKTDGLYQYSDFNMSYSSSTGALVYTLKDGLAVPSANVQPGDVKYCDLNDDDIIDTDDITNIGYSTIPEYTAGLNIGCSYKGFSLTMNWLGATNRDLSLSSQYREPFVGEDRSLLQHLVDNRWTPETSETATQPRFSASMGSYNYLDSDLWVEDASYIRLKNLTFGYDFDTTSNFFRKFGIETCGLKFTGYNLLTFSFLDFVDPETTTSYYQNYPLTKVYSLGLNLTF